MGKIKRIVIHCTATRAGEEVTKEALHKLFFDTNGWKHWGYHILVHLNGSIEELQPLPQPQEDGGYITDATLANGAKGYNWDSVHIAYVGGLDRASRKPADTRTEAQKQVLWKIVAKLKVDYKVNDVVGHYQLPGVKKDCPCFDAKYTYRNA